MDLRTRNDDLRFEKWQKTSRFGYFTNQKSLIRIQYSKELAVLELNKNFRQSLKMTVKIKKEKTISGPLFYLLTGKASPDLLNKSLITDE